MIAPIESLALVLTTDVNIVSAEVHEIRANWLAQIDTPAKRVFVDLSNVVMIDSSGLGLLVETSSILRRQGREFAIASPNNHVRTILAVTRLDKAFNVIDAIPA